MRIPGAPSLVFLGYIMVFLPWMAVRTSQRLRGPVGAGSKPLPSRSAIWIGTLVSLTGLLLMAWMGGRSFGYRIFQVPPIGARELLCAAGALALLFMLRSIVRRLRTDAERRRLAVYRLVPRSPVEWLLSSVAVLAASIAEEAAYRGVGFAILDYSLGNAWIAALICAAAFAVGHWVQGLKSGVTIFCIALVMHGLVALTGTLVLAMVVHAVYDFVAGGLIAREAARFDSTPDTPPAGLPS